MPVLPDHHCFIDSVDELVDARDLPQLTRAWRIVQGCIEVHAKVDRRPILEDAFDASESAWEDFWRCACGHPAPFAFWGLLEELRHAACPADGPMADNLQAELVAAGFRVWGDEVESAAGSGRRPALRIVR